MKLINKFTEEKSLVLHQPLLLQSPVTGGGDDVPMMGIKLIKEFEGCHLNAYPDPLSGNLPITIGWGSTRKKDGSPFKLGESITQQELMTC